MILEEALGTVEDDSDTGAAMATGVLLPGTGLGDGLWLES